MIFEFEAMSTLKAMIIAFGGWYIIYHRRTLMNEISWYTCMVAVYTADKLDISFEYLYRLSTYGVLDWATCCYWIHEFILESGGEEEGEEEGPDGLVLSDEEEGPQIYGLDLFADNDDVQFEHVVPLHGLEFDSPGWSNHSTVGSPSPYQLSPDERYD